MNGICDQLHRVCNLPRGVVFCLLFILFSVFAHAENKSRDLKAFDAQQQQEDAKKIQEMQALNKTMIKAGKEAERASTPSPGRKAQLTQEINKLKYEIDRHLEQAKALKDTADKAQKAGKQSEAGNARKGNQLRNRLVGGTLPPGAKAKPSPGGNIEVERVTEPGVSRSVENLKRFVGKGAFQRGREGTANVYLDEQASSPETLSEAQKSKREIVSEALNSFESQLQQFTGEVGAVKKNGTPLRSNAVRTLSSTRSFFTAPTKPSFSEGDSLEVEEGFLDTKRRQKKKRGRRWQRKKLLVEGGFGGFGELLDSVRTSWNRVPVSTYADNNADKKPKRGLASSLASKVEAQAFLVWNAKHWLILGSTPKMFHRSHLKTH